MAAIIAAAINSHRKAEERVPTDEARKPEMATSKMTDWRIPSKKGDKTAGLVLVRSVSCRLVQITCEAPAQNANQQGETSNRRKAFPSRVYSAQGCAAAEVPAGRASPERQHGCAIVQELNQASQGLHSFGLTTLEDTEFVRCRIRPLHGTESTTTAIKPGPVKSLVIASGVVCFAWLLDHDVDA